MDAPIIEPVTGRILIVDDDVAIRDLLTLRLNAHGFATMSSTTGKDALEVISLNEFDLVLLDVEMPELNGFDVLRQIRALHSPLELPVIMVTGRNGSTDVVNALEIGANDYVTKPVDLPVALARIRTHIALRQAQGRVVDAHLQTLKDLDAAGSMQRSLLPTHCVSNTAIRYGWQYFPCAALGGDLLNVFWITDRYLGFYVLDVSGHGIPSALMSVAVSRSLSPHLRQGSVIVDINPQSPTPIVVPPAEVARRLNGSYQMSETGGLFFTLQYGVIDLVCRTMSFVCAGHPNPVKIGGSGYPVELPCIGGPPIGVLEEAEFVEASVDLERGDRVMLFSDGVYEQRNSAGEPFGLERLRGSMAVAEPDCERATQSVLRDLRAWNGRGGFTDDISLLALQLV
ncbi:MAG: SpoIIE family protein phosphatase [Gammaproteobacteria bacterium]|nr:SpoIIE family protein phosphatase [Gammaproteobacteria bacterium]